MKKSLKSIFSNMWHSSGVNVPLEKYFFYANSPGSNWFVHETSRLKSNSHAQKYTRVNILRCVFILRCANQPESKFKLRSHGFYRQEYFCR